MERRIESYIDNILENIASQLYTLSIILGIALLLVGIVLIAWNVKKSSRMLNVVGIICLLIGMLSVSSAFLQLKGFM